MTRRKPRCYIAGPISGAPGYRDSFTTAAAQVEAMGYEAVNPCDITPVAHDGACPPGYHPGEGAGEHTSSACFMRADLRALLGCDAIFLLPGWLDSRGASVEHAVAVACGIPVAGFYACPDCGAPIVDDGHCPDCLWSPE